MPSSLIVDMLRPYWSAFIEAYRRGKKYSRNSLWKKLVMHTAHTGMVVSEAAWQWIDKEKDREILFILLFLSGDPTPGPAIMKVRNAIFEDRSILAELKAGAHNSGNLAENLDFFDK